MPYLDATDTNQYTAGFRNPGRCPKMGKRSKKTHPKFNPVSFLVLLITKDFIMFKALEKL